MKGRFRRWVQRISEWAWAEEHTKWDEALEHYSDARMIALVRSSQLAFLEELFREKQAKITRLQEAYKNKRSPKYEDMRLENPIKDAESLAQSVSMLAQRAESHRARFGTPMRISDGTVLGVPGDRPDVEVGEAWHEPT